MICALPCLGAYADFLSSAVVDSSLPCFAALGEQTAAQLRERFQQGLTQTAVEEHVNRLIETSLGSNWTRLYDSVRCSSGAPQMLYTHCIAVSVLFAIDILRLLSRTVLRSDRPFLA